MFRHLAGVAALLYGLASIVGGTYGYFKANSAMSLIAGGICGVILLLCGIGCFKGPKTAFLALLGALLVSFALAGRFLYASSSHWANLGDYLQDTPGQTAAIMIVGGFVVIVLSLLALYRRR